MRLFFLLLAGCALVAGCKPNSGILRGSAGSWMTGTTVEAGACSFRLDAAYLAHEYDWAGGARIVVTNDGEQSVRCGWSAMIVDGNGDAMGGRGGWSGSLGAGSEHEEYVDVKTRFVDEGQKDNVWLYVGVSQGWSPSEEEAWAVVDPGSEPPF